MRTMSKTLTKTLSGVPSVVRSSSPPPLADNESLVSMDQTGPDLPVFRVGSAEVLKAADKQAEGKEMADFKRQSSGKFDFAEFRPYDFLAMSAPPDGPFGDAGNSEAGKEAHTEFQPLTQPALAQTAPVTASAPPQPSPGSADLRVPGTPTAQGRILDLRCESNNLQIGDFRPLDLLAMSAPTKGAFSDCSTCEHEPDEAALPAFQPLPQPPLAQSAPLNALAASQAGSAQAAEKLGVDLSFRSGDTNSMWQSGVHLTDFRPPDFMQTAPEDQAADAEGKARFLSKSADLEATEFRPLEFFAKSAVVDPGVNLRPLQQPSLAQTAPADASPQEEPSASDTPKATSSRQAGLADRTGQPGAEDKKLKDSRRKSADLQTTEEFRPLDFLAKSAPAEPPGGRDLRPLKQAPLARSAPVSENEKSKGQRRDSAPLNTLKPSPQGKGSVGARAVYAWRYGRAGVWHSVRDCTIELQHGSLLVRRGGMLQQALPCTSITQAITYGTLGRLIVAAQPGVDSLFVSLDKEVLGGLVKALAGNGITVKRVGYADFYGLQKDLLFPATPLLDSSQLDTKATEPVPLRTRSGLPTGGVQVELGKQLDALRAQQAQLERLEAQLLAMANAAAP